METKARRQLLGKRLSEERKSAGLSQRELALSISTSQSYVWEVEKGRVSASIDFLCRVADALNIKVSDLIEF